jgi:glycosyltransferase involved in cell wall biosynthesis
VHENVLHVVAPVGLDSAGFTILACRIATALTSAGRTSVPWVPDSERHPDAANADRYSDLGELLTRLKESKVLLVGLHPNLELAQLQIDLLGNNPQWRLIWERPGRTSPRDVANDLRGIERLRSVLTLNALLLGDVAAAASGAVVSVIPPAIPNECLQAFDGTQSSSPLIISLGRLSPEKGIDSLANLWATSGGLGRELELVVATPTTARLQVSSPFVKQVVLGSVTERIELLKSATAAIFPATSDHLPQALLEAMAVGATVIATDIPGHTEVVADGVTGLLIHVDLADLDAALDRLSAELAFSIRNNAHKLVLNSYSYGAFVEAWNRVEAGV